MADILLTINSTAAPVNIGEVKLSAPIAIGDVGIRLPGPQGEPETPGQDGGDGVSIEYRWNGTELGIKREDEVNYQYANLKGEKGNKGDTGEEGPQGIPGLDGKSLEFHWNGTQLGIRTEGETTYQYVNLQGIQGIQGVKGDKGDKGEKGDQGDQGIQGPKGDKGDKGDSGYTPIRGTDYWTSADKADIVSDVLAALPDGDEVEY